MKRHTLAEHLQSFDDWYEAASASRTTVWGPLGYIDGDEFSRIRWFTAYERWLNDRALLSDEDAKEEA
jgi:hypothetical protein